MERHDLAEALVSVVGSARCFADYPLSGCTTFAIGGPVDFMVEPAAEEEVRAVVVLCEEHGIPWRVLGSGSNVLVSDAGVRGVVLRFAAPFSTISCEGDLITAQAGASNAAVASVALRAGLSGYEFASGIPGTIGGAAIMNAGAYEGEFKDVATAVRCLGHDGTFMDLSAEEAQWGYRTSRMQQEGLVVLSATLKLMAQEVAVIESAMADLEARRRSKQPLDLPSAGSTFKRPEGHYAGKLIQESGMQGARVGGAQVSEKHAGFVVNTGGASAQDVLALIAMVQERVCERFGVVLEPEVRLWD